MGIRTGRAKSLSTTSGPVLEVFADIWCPFAHVGLQTIRRQRARAGRADVTILVRAWPLELVNGAPLDASATWDHVNELREQVAPDLFRDFDISRFPSSTLDALSLANRAYRTAPEVGELVSFALREALFEEGQDVSDRITLEHIAHTFAIAPCGRIRSCQVSWRTGMRGSNVVSSARRTSSAATQTSFVRRSEITKDPVKGTSIIRDTSPLDGFSGALSSSVATGPRRLWERPAHAVCASTTGLVQQQRTDPPQGRAPTFTHC